MQKSKPIRLKKIRESARGQSCQLNSPYCTYNDEQTVFCHYAEPGEKGIGLKPDDSSGFYGCEQCHSWIDGRIPTKFNDPDKLPLIFRACRRTWRLLITEGVLR